MWTPGHRITEILPSRQRGAILGWARDWYFINLAATRQLTRRHLSDCASSRSGTQLAHRNTPCAAFRVEVKGSQLPVCHQELAPLSLWVFNPAEKRHPPLVRHPPGNGRQRHRFSCHSDKISSAPTRTMSASLVLLRRSEPPTAVVHETICGQVHWSVADAMP